MKKKKNKPAAYEAPSRRITPNNPVLDAYLPAIEPPESRVIETETETELQIQTPGRHMVSLGEIREWIEATVHHAVQQELLRRVLTNAVPTPTEPSGEDVSDQGPSLASDQDDPAAPTPTPLPIRITITAVTDTSWGAAYISSRMLAQLQQDYYEVFPYLQVVESVRVDER